MNILIPNQHDVSCCELAATCIAGDTIGVFPIDIVDSVERYIINVVHFRR